MQVFLTGSTGFIGGYLLRELSARGHSVRALIRNPKQVESLGDFADRVVIGDLDDLEALSDGVAGADAVIHTAALMAAANPRDYQRTNVRGTHNLLRVSSSIARQLDRFLFLSSITAAGPSTPGVPLQEDHPPAPISRYGQSKLEGERLVWSFSDRFDVTIVRPPLVYGPWDRDRVEIFRQVQAGQVRIVSRPDAQVSVLFVSDLATGVANALENPAAANELFYLTGKSRPTVLELVRTVEEQMGVEAGLMRLPGPAAKTLAATSEAWAMLRRRRPTLTRDRLREFMASGWTCSGEKAKRLLGFQPEINFREGIRQTAEWYMERGWLSSWY